jgi:hypothetical protein
MSPPDLEKAPSPVLTNEAERLPEDSGIPEIPPKVNIDPLLKQQVYYALEVGQVIVRLSSMENTDTTAKMTLQVFLEHFRDGLDPWVRTVYYDLVNDDLIIVMQEGDGVMPLLKGAEIVIDIDLALPVCGERVTEAMDTIEIPSVSTAKTPAIKPNFLDALQCMGTLTAHCYHPQEHATGPDKWPESEWCPLWHAYVMFP